MLVISQQPYDEGRKNDIDKLKLRASDPSRSAKERKVAEEVQYALKHQNSSPAIRILRERLHRATVNGDKETIERLSKQGENIDRDYKL